MTYEELKYRQGWTLEQKIDHSVGVVSAFLAKTNGNAYISYSGGKDSGTMLDIIRRFVDKNIPAVFCNTGNEYTEVVKFVRQTDNLITIRPEIHIKQLIEKYGFPLISKEQSQYIRQAKHTNSEKLRNIRLNGSINGIGKIAERWKFLIDAPFDVSEKCCYFLKKKPFAKFQKQTGLFPIIGTMAGESRFYFLKEYKPKIYEYFMQMQNNGVTYKEALRFCGIDFPDGMNRQTKEIKL
ncbi:hypothetical protein FACS189437_01730 [Bacteroidia bacterium]|nr:hypothetical protein FACS189437_01730 [Bacteroidia bacterium]